MLTIILGIAWSLVLALSPLAQRPPSRADLNHCAALPHPSCWEGQPCFRQPPRFSDPREKELVCFPKDGCWLTKAGDAMCWRTVTLKGTARR